jgi:uncharacterized protein (DUF2336 family)
VSASDFRQIAIKGEARRAERLFRAAVSAFCSLTRPSRREIAQLEDLALPLFDMVSAQSRRFVAAALSECESAPKALVDRLCGEPVDIAAPLLVRSRALSDIDLIALIGRHGLPHARAIARRRGLNPTIAHLIRALERRSPGSVGTPPQPAGKAAIAEDEVPANPGDAADNVRRRLRSMMMPAGSGGDHDPTEDSRYAKLSSAALTGNPALFQAALANALDVYAAVARSATDTSSHAALLVALRALDLTEERAFLIAAAVFPGHFAHAEAIRLFLERYRALDRDAALDRVRNWRMEAVVQSVRRNALPPVAGNAARPGDRFTPQQPG